MPGTQETNGGFTQAELVAMTIEDLQAVREGRLTKEMGEQIVKGLARGVRAAAEAHQLANLPSPPPQDRYAATSWASNEYDFQVPSGQLCRMRKLQIEELVAAGILDKVSRLPGLADEVVSAAEGKKPSVIDQIPDKETMEKLAEVLNQLLPMVIVAPTVVTPPEDPNERKDGVVYVDSIELADRIAIMERAMSGVTKFDNFRSES